VSLSRPVGSLGEVIPGPEGAADPKAQLVKSASYLSVLAMHRKMRKYELKMEKGGIKM